MVTTREDAEGYVWETLNGLENALGNGDDEAVERHQRSFMSEMTEYSRLLSSGVRANLSRRYREIMNGETN